MKIDPLGQRHYGEEVVHQKAGEPSHLRLPFSTFINDLIAGLTSDLKFLGEGVEIFDPGKGRVRLAHTRGETDGLSHSQTGTARRDPGFPSPRSGL